jgi:hypothetical protein
MNKIKKAIKTLQDYLGRDTEGLRLLEQVTRLANDARTEAAKLRESNDSKDATIERMKAEIVSCNNRNAELTRDVARMESQRRQMQVTTDRLAAKVAQLESEPETNETVEIVYCPRVAPGRKATRLTADIRGFMDMCKALRREVKTAPVAFPKAGKTFHLPLENVIQNYSTLSMATLGRVVASMALMGFPPIVKADATLNDTYGGNWTDSENTQIWNFIEWFRTNLAYDDTSQRMGKRTGIHSKCPGLNTQMGLAPPD